MRCVLVLFLSLLLPLGLFAQIEIGQETGWVNLVENTQVKALQVAPGTDFDTVLQTPFQASYDSSFLPSPDKDIWLKFTLIKVDTINMAYYIFSREPYFTVYQENTLGWHISKNGFLRPQNKRTNKATKKFLKVNLIQFQPTQLYIQLQGHDLVESKRFPWLGSELGYYQWRKTNEEQNKFGNTFSLIYLSGLMMISFFILILFISVRESIYIYYLFFLLFQILYSITTIVKSELSLLDNIIHFPILAYTTSEALQFTFIGFYILFILNLLDVRKFDLRLTKAMRILAWICFIYALFNLAYKFSFPDVYGSSFLFRNIRIIVLPLNLLLIVWVIIKVKHPLLVYFILANIFFYTGSILSTYVAITFNISPDSVFHYAQSKHTIFQMGLLGEVLCFSFAIAHHVKLAYQGREENSKALIHQLKENQRIQETMNEKLDKKVNDKTAELIKVYSQIEKQREQDIKNEFSQKIKEMEMLALRAQMNPHFLFNSMNALKHLIMMDRSDDAMSYLDDFASLLRGVLHNSKRDAITVEDELELLELYLSLEKGRLGSSFEYKIQVDSKDDLSQYPIPTLLLQPFVENAIWHGLQHSQNKKKELAISFSSSKDLVISIYDNGIGRDAAKELQDKKALHKSFGTEITKERLELFNNLHELKISLNIKDLMENGIPAGTLVCFTYSIP